MTTETYQYRGYDIVPMWQWSSWCTGIYSLTCPYCHAVLCVPWRWKRTKPWLRRSIASTNFSLHARNYLQLAED